MAGCLNCANYLWEEVRIASNVHVQESLMRCKKCKIAFYCGRDCQVEHWLKVHKEKCKYHRGDKEQVAGVHRHLASMCNGCKEEQDLKQGDWGCHMQNKPSFWDYPFMIYPGLNGERHKVPLAVELGEFTGKFSSRFEHVASLLQKIIHKMDMTSHTLSRNKQFIQLTGEVFNLRYLIIKYAAVIPFNMIQIYNGPTTVRQDILNIIQELGTKYEDDVNDVHRLWDTFTLIFEFFFNNETYLLKGFENSGIKVKEKTVKRLLGQVEKSEKMEEKWDKIGSVLSSGTVPFLTILEIVIGGLHQECSSCEEYINIKSIHGYYPVGSEREKMPNVVCRDTLFRFCCGQLNCRIEVVETFNKDMTYIFDFLFESMKDLNRCDWCMGMKKTLHRCRRCLTKMYCSEECANMDWWAAHKEICKEKPDFWKQKGKTLL